jgi:hypothetical protein
MIALWESPFDYFLLLDADICMWGNLAKNVNWKEFNIVVDQPQYDFSIADMNIWFFDTEELKKIDSSFDPLKYKNSFCCPGVYFAQKNCFPVDWYQELLEYSNANPGVFKYGDMGIINYMIFKSADRELIKVKNQYIQHICP